MDHFLSRIEVTEVYCDQGFMLVQHYCSAYWTRVSYGQLSHDKEVIKYGELNWYYYLIVREYADIYLGNSISVRLLFYFG